MIKSREVFPLCFFVFGFIPRAAGRAQPDGGLFFPAKKGRLAAPMGRMDQFSGLYSPKVTVTVMRSFDRRMVNVAVSPAL